MNRPTSPIVFLSIFRRILILLSNFFSLQQSGPRSATSRQREPSWNLTRDRESCLNLPPPLFPCPFSVLADEVTPKAEVTDPAHPKSPTRLRQRHRSRTCSRYLPRVIKCDARRGGLPANRTTQRGDAHLFLSRPSGRELITLGPGDFSASAQVNVQPRRRSLDAQNSNSSINLQSPGSRLQN